MRSARQPPQRWQLRSLREGDAASIQLSSLLAFIAAHERLPDRMCRGVTRIFVHAAAVLGVLESLRDAHRAHDDRPVPLADLLATVRRWIESQTFSPRTGSNGMMLLDAPAAAYADIDDLRLVGLVDADWPERSRRSIFYPSQLLAQLGWPAEADRLAAARARFHDLLRLPRVRVSASTFTLEDDAIVPASVVSRRDRSRRLAVQHLPAPDGARVFLHEALAEEPTVASALVARRCEWLTLRASRSPGTDLRITGTAGPREPAVYSVSSLERYLECPFKYFAAHVLRLPEERADESGLTPQERGQFLHEVFEVFFTRMAGVRAAQRDHQRHHGRCRADCSRTSPNVISRRCRSPTGRSSARISWDRRQPPGSRSARSRLKSSREAKSSSGCSSTNCEGAFRISDRDRAIGRCGSARRPIASI